GPTRIRVLLPKRRGTIASAGRTPSSRRLAVLAGMETVQVSEVARAEETEAGRAEQRAGPVPGWGRAACASRCLGQRDGASAGLEPRPRQPPRGADHPHPTPPARDAN